MATAAVQYAPEVDMRLLAIVGMVWLLVLGCSSSGGGDGDGDIDIDADTDTGTGTGTGGGTLRDYCEKAVSCSGGSLADCLEQNDGTSQACINCRLPLSCELFWTQCDAECAEL